MRLVSSPRESWHLQHSTATEGKKRREGFHHHNASTLGLYLLLLYMLLGDVLGQASNNCSFGVYNVKSQLDLDAIKPCVNFTGDIVIDPSFGGTNLRAGDGLTIYIPNLVNMNGSFEIIDNNNIETLRFGSLANINQPFTLRNLSNLRFIFFPGSTNFGIVNLSYLPNSGILFISSNSVLVIDQLVAIDVAYYGLNSLFSNSNSTISSISIINHSSEDDFLIFSQMRSIYVSSPGALTIQRTQSLIETFYVNTGPSITVTGLSTFRMPLFYTTRDLIITNTSLRTFDAHSLQFTTGLTITNNPKLELFELESLHVVHQTLVIANNSLLQDITGAFIILSVNDVILEGNFSLLPNQIFQAEVWINGNISYIGNSESNCTAWEKFSQTKYTHWLNSAVEETTSEGRLTCVARQPSTSSTSANRPTPIATDDPSGSTSSESTAKSTPKPLNKTPIIAGSVAGVVAFLALITGSILLYSRRRFRQQAPIPTEPELNSTGNPTELAAREKLLLVEMPGDGAWAEMPGDFGQRHELDGQSGQSVPLVATGEQRTESNISERNEDKGNSADTNIATASPMKRKPVAQPHGS